jgi:hypothetical protein
VRQPRAADVVLYGGLAAGILDILDILACRRWPRMIEKPLQAGVAYGLLTWAAMNYVVVRTSS